MATATGIIKNRYLNKRKQCEDITVSKETEQNMERPTVDEI